MVARISLYFIFLNLLLPGVSAQQRVEIQFSDKRDESVLASISSNVEKLRRKISKDDSRAIELLNNISKAVNDIQNIHREIRSQDEQLSSQGRSVTIEEEEGAFTRQIVNDKYITNFSDDYISSLKMLDDLLDEIIDSAAKMSSDELYDALVIIKDDLEVKVSYLRKGIFPKHESTVVKIHGAFEPATTITREVGKVTVIVRAMQGNNQVNGLEIYYVPIGWAKRPDRYSRFKTITSPTKPELLAPGDYFMWIGKDALRTEWRIVPIDEGASQVVDLPVPNP